MGYREVIENIKIEGSKFNVIKNSFYKNLNFRIKNVYQVRKGRHVHMVELEDGSFVRLDIFPRNHKNLKIIPYQQLINEKNIVKIPKLIKIFNVNWKSRIFKVSEWIEGVRIKEVWNLEKMFRKCGEEIAKLNSIKVPTTEKHFNLRDFSKINLIWTKSEEVYIIDLLLEPSDNIDKIITKTLIIGLKTKNRIYEFLEGYSTIRSIDCILEELEKSNWMWKNFKVMKETKKDILI